MKRFKGIYNKMLIVVFFGMGVDCGYGGLKEEFCFLVYRVFYCLRVF